MMSHERYPEIIAFGGSNSKSSINKKFASYVCGLLNDFDSSVLDLNDFEMPLYSIDREGEQGIPEEALTFAARIEEASGIIISLAEHNGSFTVAFKNIVDWMSRSKRRVWKGKKILLLSTSPGKRGGASALKLGLGSLPYWGAEIVAHFSLPLFYENFDDEKGVLNESLRLELLNAVDKFESQLKTTEK